MVDQGDRISPWVPDKVPKRKPNWTETEQIIMLDLYAKYKEVLATRENTILNCRQKADCWVNITNQLNQINTTSKRSIEEVKRKWHNLIGQGRRDFFDWRRAQQDPKLPPVTMPVISRRALELHWNFRFEDWKNRTEDIGSNDASSQDDDELIYLDASDTEMCEIDNNSEQLFPPTGSKVKQECPSPISVEDIPNEHSSSSVAAVAMLLQRPSTSSSQGGTVSSPSLMPLRQVWAASPAAPTAPTYPSKNHFSMVSPGLNYAPDIQIQHLGTQTSANLNHLPLASVNPAPVTTATINHNVPSAVDPTALLEPSSLLSQGANYPHPSEPARKKYRGSETALSERESELRMDILQLEKDKLWLETEKLRLEIDILRKRKQQMDNNF